MIEVAYLRLVVWLNRKAKSIAVRLTHLTGKSSVAIHPKHLILAGENKAWYLRYITPELRVLDVGCANGVHSLRAASQGAEVVGVDYSFAHLQTAQILAVQKNRQKAAFFIGNLEQGLPLLNEQFDLVLLLDVIEHLHKRIGLLRGIHQVLGKDGTLLVTVPNGHTTWKRRLRAAGLPHYTDPDHKWEYTWDELCAELRAGGFEPVGVPLPVVYDTAWAGMIDLVGGLWLGLYRLLSDWKGRLAQEKPEESIGWRVVCRRIDTTS